MPGTSFNMLQDLPRSQLGIRQLYHLPNYQIMSAFTCICLYVWSFWLDWSLGVLSIVLHVWAQYVYNIYIYIWCSKSIPNLKKSWPAMRRNIFAALRPTGRCLVPTANFWAPRDPAAPASSTNERSRGWTPYVTKPAGWCLKTSWFYPFEGWKKKNRKKNMIFWKWWPMFGAFVWCLWVMVLWCHIHHHWTVHFWCALIFQSCLQQYSVGKTNKVLLLLEDVKPTNFSMRPLGPPWQQLSQDSKL